MVRGPVGPARTTQEILSCLPSSTSSSASVRARSCRQLEAVAKAVNAIEDDFVAMSDEELQGMTVEFKRRLEDGETLDDMHAGGVRHRSARRASRVLGHAPLRRPAHGWRGPAPRQHRRDEDR